MTLCGASLVAQAVKNLPAMQETWLRFLGGEDPLEREVAPTPVSLPGEAHGQRSLAGTVHGVAGVGHAGGTNPPPWLCVLLVGVHPKTLTVVTS